MTVLPELGQHLLTSSLKHTDLFYVQGQPVRSKCRSVFKTRASGLFLHIHNERSGLYDLDWALGTIKDTGKPVKRHCVFSVCVKTNTFAHVRELYIESASSSACP